MPGAGRLLPTAHDPRNAEVFQVFFGNSRPGEGETLVQGLGPFGGEAVLFRQTDPSYAGARRHPRGPPSAGRTRQVPGWTNLAALGGSGGGRRMVGPSPALATKSPWGLL